MRDKIVWFLRWVCCLVFVVGTACLAAVVAGAMVLWVVGSEGVALFGSGMAAGVVIDRFTDVIYGKFFKH